MIPHRHLTKSLQTLLAFLAFFTTPYTLYADGYNSVSFFVVAHPDDWQLFMGKHANEVAGIPSRKMVFIYVTAGDAGAGNSIRDMGKIPYFMAREFAAMKSTIFLCQSVSDSNRDSYSITAVNSHSIVVRRYKNTVSYYLRLPDGGVEAQGQHALKKLYKNQITTLNSVDNQNQYTGWQDIVETISSIIRTETAGITDLKEINMPDIAGTRNNGDHVDHYMAGVLALSATKNSCFSNILYQGYKIAKEPSDLNMDAVLFKRNLLRQIGNELAGDGYADCQDDGHVAFTKNEKWIVENNACTFHDPFASFVRTRGYRMEDVADTSDYFAIKLYPNPAGSQVYMLISDATEDLYRIVLYDMQGTAVKTKALHLDKNSSEVSIDTESLPAGNYIVRLEGGNQRATASFIKN
ncbi:hypothetical protein GCM10023092_27200 [Rurimicrobium arvi]|uniref:Secretion system C-terminal sorting domain-containing protein n=2 Tax=Rurimicrobium arvi TaxID=2049916 RepID=A0ABP8MZ77_9BACT